MPAAQITRTRTGCLTCRARRTKCDERRDVCSHCERLYLECRWPQVDARPYPRPPPPAKSEPSSGPSRARACLRCRTDKSRCDGDGAKTCGRCFKKGWKCAYAKQNEMDGKDGSRSGTPYGAQLDPTEVYRLVQAFFDANQPRHTLTFLHRDSVLTQVAARRSPTSLAILLAALGLRALSRLPHDRARANGWVEAARVDVLSARSGDAFSTSRLGAILLLKVYDESRGDHGDSWLLTGLAVRMAVGMQLNKEDTKGTSEGEKEIKRRLMWSCFLADRLLGAGQADFTVCQTSIIKTRLPRRQDEIASPSTMPRLEEVLAGRGLDQVQRHGDLLTFYVWLVEIRHRALLYAKNLDESSVMPWQPGSPYYVLLDDLSLWRSTYDAALLRSAQSLDISVPEILAQYYQIHTDLQRLAMPGFQESLPASFVPLAPPAWITTTRQQCVDNALALCEILRKKIATSGMQAFVDKSVIVFVYEAMRIQLQYISLAETKLDNAMRGVLIQNFSTGLRIVTEMGEAFEELRPFVKIIRSLLIRHGVPIGPEEDDDDESVDGNDGRVLSKMHYLRMQRRSSAKDDFPYPAAPSGSPAHLSTPPKASSASMPYTPDEQLFSPSYSALSSSHDGSISLSGPTAGQSWTNSGNLLDDFSWDALKDNNYATVDPFLWTLEDWTAIAS